ncbi:MAG: MBL fold metallo-hydrolase [Chitinophagaceae bacterium]|nr:MBL fold metallo-hydrolase [Chitinophagaceae bacterium]
MEEKKKYLKPNVVIEPLYGRWYAWSHLISPATAAMNITDRHISIIESYLAAPEIHAQSVLNPKMRGGPFMDFKGGKLPEVRKLLEDTLRLQARQVEFSKAIKSLDKMLLTEAKGFGLEELYEKVPAILRGYVELFYDRNNNAGFRFFESLLYQSEYYDKRSQSIALWITNNDHRPFCLSTPRLDEPDILHLNTPFDDPALDELAEMRRTAGLPSLLGKRLGVTESQKPVFDNLFTEEAPPKYARYSGDKIRMRYFGHACILIETNGVSILADPLVSYYGYHSDVEHFSEMDLPDVIDYVLITHNHQDHILFETLLSLRPRIRNVIVPRTCSGKLQDPDLKLMFKNIGFNNVIAVDEMESIEFADTTITGLPFTGEHSDLDILTKTCYLVEVSGFKLLFLADSRIMEPRLYQHIKRQIGNVDVMFLGMECDGAPLSWLYGPLMPKRLARDQDGSRRLAGSDCAKGMSLVEIFSPREVYVYAMGQEPWLEFISSIKYTDESNPIVQSNRLVNLCQNRGIIAERLFGEKELLYHRKPKATEVLEAR